MPPLLKPLPDHVPPALLYDYPFRRGYITSERTPWEVIDEIIADAPPIFYSPVVNTLSDGWVVSDGATCRTLLSDVAHFSRKTKFEVREASARRFLLVPATVDPPDHRPLRMMLNPLFTAARMAALDDEIRAAARLYAEALRDRGECEFVSEFAFQFPIRVFLTMMGLPLEMTAQFLEWERNLIRGADIRVVGEVINQVFAYLEGEIEERRRRPREDLISQGMAASYEGRRLDEDELIGFCFNLFTGGLDTVSASMSHHFAHLAQRPDQQAWLREDPSRAPDAVKELLRAFAPITQVRACIKPIEVLGQTILPGDRIALPTAVANRDPELYDQPSEVRLDRNPRHMTFGGGEVICIGMHLARRELTIALQEFLRIIPEFAIAPGESIAYDFGGVPQPVAVPLVWAA
jgi:cytochrome P450